MYKIFDSPKEPADVVNKRYVDNLLIPNYFNVEINDNDWDFDNDENSFVFLINHNLNTNNIIVTFYNKENMICYAGYKVLDVNTLAIYVNVSDYLRILVTYFVDVVPSEQILVSNIKINGPDIIYI